jgi:phosphopantothenoylcysteine decarboxylase/phosphopantothenate--cysteine ligase
MANIPLVNLTDRKILLGVSGGVAAFKAVALASLLRQSQAQVEVVMTKAATKLIGPASFQAFTGRQVKTKIFVAQESITANHIALAQWAEIYVIAPATANTLAKLAWGFAGNLLTCTALAVTCPKLIAPAMNTHMWNNQAVQENVSRLRNFGYHFVGPTQGHLSCGVSGPGRMVEAEDIYSAIVDILNRR